MKIALLHHDLEESEEILKRLLEERRIKVKLLDIRNTEIGDFEGVDLVLNRVYASVANRDFASNEKTLMLLKQLEGREIRCVNSLLTSFYDYSKYDTYKVMESNGIITPRTVFISKREEIERISKEAIAELGLPIIVKRNSGGRAKDLFKADTEERLIEILESRFDLAGEEGYRGGFILQNLIKSNRDFDCRVGIVGGEFAFSYGRNLVADESGEKWFSSVSKGSERIVFEVDEKEKEIAIQISKLIGADYNVVDIMYADEGPVVIENNPTPNYVNNDKDDISRMNKFIDVLLEGER
jgi:gamma-F420-2:alpha-L-glutamate ligase